MTLATRSAAVAVVAVVALGAILAFVRTAPVGTNEPTPSPAATASAVPTGMTVAAFKVARDAICTEAQSTNARLAPRYRKIIDPVATAAELADGMAALRDFVNLSSQTTDQLAQLAVPLGLEQGQAINLAQFRDIVAILQHELELLNAGDFADARAVDLSTDAISRQISAWEAEYDFLNCP